MTNLGWVGRFSTEKGADVFIEALVHLWDLPWRASLLGGGPGERGIRRLITEHGLADRVSLMGVVQGASRLFRGFDVLVLSSRTEGIPLVLLEAMRADVPIVAARVGGVPEVVDPDEAILVPPADPVALAAGIRRCLEDPSAAEARAASARRRLAGEFALATWAEGYLGTYERLVSDRRTKVSGGV